VKDRVTIDVQQAKTRNERSIVTHVDNRTAARSLAAFAGASTAAC
jgi:hypothetical protein